MFEKKYWLFDSSHVCHNFKKKKNIDGLDPSDGFLILTFRKKKNSKGIPLKIYLENLYQIKRIFEASNNKKSLTKKRSGDPKLRGTGLAAMFPCT